MTRTSHAAYTVGAASFAARIAADFIALIVTWSQTFRQVRLASSAGLSTSYSKIVLRDGVFVHCSLLIHHAKCFLVLGSIFFV